MRRPIVLGIIASVLLALALAGAASASASERIDMKVLLLGTSTTEPDFVSWQAALQREGVPFQAIVTSPGHTPITAATLSDTLANGTPEAKYQAVIVSVGALPECGESGCVSTLSQAEWTALEEYEHTFSVRQLTGDIYPSATYGLNSPMSSGALDGTQGALTTEGKTVFPYLKGSVAMDTGTYGYEATQLSTQLAGASFRTLVSGPSSSALVGIYTHPDGVQEMVESFDENQNQLQAELLRHGALNWITRGVYFGDQRNYYEADIDDNFLSDDSWSTTEHTTDYNPADAIRETATDVNYAASWSAQNKFRMDMLFNGGGSAQYQIEHGSDPLLTAFQKDKSSFGWISHTWDHPNLDVGCASQSYIEAELNENTSWAATSLGLTESTSPTAALGNDNPSVIITGEHSGLANLLPGNPGVVDPPDLDSAEADTTEVEGTLAPGSYVYAVTDDFTPGGGQSIASESSPVAVTGSNGSVTLSWAAVCHAAEFKVYREKAGSNQWTLIATIAAPTQSPPNIWFGNPTTNTAVAGGGPLEVTYTDAGATGTASAGPPAASEAIETAYAQNPSLVSAFSATGIQYFGSDASKAYPNPAVPGSITAAYPAGSTFTDGTGEAIPRYPTNIYYNVSTEAEEVDEFNSLYTPTAEGGKCVASANTTCETKAATFAEIVSDVDTNMFGHVMGNDPRPHYFHQPNIMGTPPPGPPTTGTPPATSKTVGDGLFYSVLNPLLEEYNKYFNAPIEQPTMAQIGQLLAEQQAWSAANTGQVSGYIEGNKVTVNNAGSGAVSAPLTGTEVGSTYGGITSGWTSAPVATSTHTAQISWPESLRVTTTSVPAGRVGSSYSQTLAASGGAPPYVWSITAGSLPAGLSLNTASGAITGTPAAAANSSLTLTVSDASSPTQQTATVSLSITVLPNPPTVVTGKGGLINQMTATLNASVNPNAGEVSECRFEYGTTSSYGSSAPCSPSPGSGSGPVAVSVSLTGLAANTTYHFRISATNAGGNSTGSDQALATPPNPATVATESASAVAPTSATPNATVNPNGADVSECTFEYGTSTAYGQNAPCSSLPEAVEYPVAVSASLTGLAANTTYHYRISATNPSGPSKGADEEFKTPPSCSAEGFCASFTPPNDIEGSFSEPDAVALDPSGNIFIADSGHDRVLEFNSKHEYLRQFGSEGSAEGQFRGIRGIAADSSGDLYASDYANNRIEEFSPSGAFLRQFGSGKLIEPTAIALDPGGEVWVLSSYGTPVQEYSPSGEYLTGWGSEGSGNGQFQKPSGLAFSGGNLYVSDWSDERVQELSSSGSYIGQFDEHGSGTGTSSLPWGIASDPTTGNLYVTEVGNDRVQEFSAAGSFITTFGSFGSGAGELSAPKGIAVGPSGTVFIADTANNRIQEWMPAGGSAPPTYAASFTPPNDIEGSFSEPDAVALDPSGNIFIADSGHDRVLEFNSKHEYLRQFGSEGSAEGQFRGIRGIAADSSGDLYASDYANNRIEEFSPSGAFLRQFGSGKLIEPTAIALDPGGEVWVLSSYGTPVQEYSPSGEYLTGWGSEGSGNGQFQKPSGLAFSGGNLYVSDWSDERVQELSSSGSYIGQFDPHGSGTGTSSLPWGIASDPTTGNLYVTEVGNDRVQEFSAAGSFITTFGSFGSGAGELSAPKGLAVGSAGQIYVADTVNDRVEEWLLP